MEFYKSINKELLKLYGKDINLRPMYRIIQNYNLTEKRFGSVFYGDIELPNKQVIETPKYSYIPDGFWILEQLFNTTNPELTSTFTYEPVWVFKTKDGEYQAPNLKACIFVIEASRRGPVALETEDEKKKKEIATFREMLGGNAGIAESIAAQSGTSMVGLDAPSLMKGQ
jgi:hypothetical protein